MKDQVSVSRLKSSLNNTKLTLSGHSHSHPDAHSHSHGPNNSHSHSHSGPSGGHSHRHPTSKSKRFRPTDFDMDKLRSTLKQFVRDWSEEVRNILCSLQKVANGNTGEGRERLLLWTPEGRASAAFLQCAGGRTVCGPGFRSMRCTEVTTVLSYASLFQALDLAVSLTMLLNLVGPLHELTALTITPIANSDALRILLPRQRIFSLYAPRIVFHPQQVSDLTF